MSVQFGKCNFDGKPVDPEDLDAVRPVLSPYGPDGEGCTCKDNFGILYRAFHTTKESRREVQPHVFASGAVLTWDGRLDNREELIGQLTNRVSRESSDLEIAGAGYERWGIATFAKLIGDWALSIWDPKDRSLILAKDFVGTRPLYYSVDKDHITWSTILDPLVLLGGHSFELEEEYIAGWLAFFPAPHLTPYVGIRSVPPSSFVRLTRGIQNVVKYWDFDQASTIRYRTDAEYEEHFRVVFSESVRRRLRSDSPILAELSGGMDSSSIVCTADSILEREAIGTPRLDTISYYDDGEPNWNERRYFTEVEQKRGRIGCHVDVSPTIAPDSESKIDSFASTPAHGSYSPRVHQQVADCMKLQGNRVLLSGIGGDEVTGGVPTPFPELADALAQGHFAELVRLLKTWALSTRRPWVHLLGKTLAAFIHPKIIGLPRDNTPAPWLREAFARRNRGALSGYVRRFKLCDALPSFQENIKTLCSLRRQLACSVTPSDPPCEKRYPYLDRDFIEFLYRIPREQLVRPGRRRSLMRRSLIGTVPSAILDRRRKASVALGPIRIIGIEAARLGDVRCGLVTTQLGILDPVRFREALVDIQAGRETRLVGVLRALDLECWLRELRERELLVAMSTNHKREQALIDIDAVFSQDWSRVQLAEGASH